MPTSGSAGVATNRRLGGLLIDAGDPIAECAVVLANRSGRLIVKWMRSLLALGLGFAATWGAFWFAVAPLFILYIIVEEGSTDGSAQPWDAAFSVILALSFGVGGAVTAAAAPGHRIAHALALVAVFFLVLPGITGGRHFFGDSSVSFFAETALSIACCAGGAFLIEKRARQRSERREEGGAA